MRDQPDLLSWQPTRPPTADVIAFPGGRRIGKARRTAAVMLTKTSDRGRQAYWQQIVDGLTASMAGVGISDDEIARQLRGFTELVGAEMQRLQHGGRAQA